MKALEFNRLSPNLLASGGADGELKIWDISDPKSPTPYPAVAVSVCTCINCKTMATFDAELNGQSPDGKIARGQSHNRIRLEGVASPGAGTQSK